MNAIEEGKIKIFHFDHPVDIPFKYLNSSGISKSVAAWRQWEISRSTQLYIHMATIQNPCPRSFCHPNLPASLDLLSPNLTSYSLLFHYGNTPGILLSTDTEKKSSYWSEWTYLNQSRCFCIKHMGTISWRRQRNTPALPTKCAWEQVTDTVVLPCRRIYPSPKIYSMFVKNYAVDRKKKSPFPIFTAWDSHFQS